jgi:hypothetical protein
MVGEGLNEEMASRQDSHYRGPGEQTKVRSTQTSNAFEASAGSHGQGSGAADERCAGNAETARPSVASRACFRRTTANCCAVGG